MLNLIFKVLKIIFVLSGKNASQPAVLIYIPDGSKKEPPTTYMSITNQIYHTYVVNIIVVNRVQLLIFNLYCFILRLV